MTTPAFSLVQPEPSQPGGGLSWDDMDPGFKLREAGLVVDVEAFERARVRMRLTKETVGKRAHRGTKVYWRVINGQIRTIEPVRAFARALGMSPDEAFLP